MLVDSLKVYDSCDCSNESYTSRQCPLAPTSFKLDVCKVPVDAINALNSSSLPRSRPYETVKNISK